MVNSLNADWAIYIKDLMRLFHIYRRSQQCSYPRKSVKIAVWVSRGVQQTWNAMLLIPLDNEYSQLPRLNQTRGIALVYPPPSPPTIQCRQLFSLNNGLHVGKTRTLVSKYTLYLRNRVTICHRVVRGRPQPPVKSHEYHGHLISNPFKISWPEETLKHLLWGSIHSTLKYEEELLVERVG